MNAHDHAPCNALDGLACEVAREMAAQLIADRILAHRLLPEAIASAITLGMALMVSCPEWSQAVLRAADRHIAPHPPYTTQVRALVAAHPIAMAVSE